MTGSPETTSAGNGIGDEKYDHVRAERVEISQGGANSIEATTVSLEQGGAVRVNAEQMSVGQGGVLLARTDTLKLDQGASGFAVIADRAEIREGSSVFMLFARSVTGDMRPMLDWRAGLAFGAGLGLVLRLFRRR